MKKGILSIIGIMVGLFFFQTPFATAARETGANLASALTKIRMAQAKAEEAFRQGEKLRANLEKSIEVAESAQAKAKEVLSRTSLEERLARAVLLADTKEETPEMMASNLDERGIKISQISGIKASADADQVVKKAEEVLGLIDEAISVSEDALAQAEIAMKDSDSAISQATTIEVLANKAVALIRKASTQQKEIARETALAADEAARADYYSRYRKREEKEEIEADKFARMEEKKIPLIRTFKAPPLKGRPKIREHTVVGGDTLWFIADHYYKDPFKWPNIYEVNKEKIKDPHWIYPDQVFIIPEAE